MRRLSDERVEAREHVGDRSAWVREERRERRRHPFRCAPRVGVESEDGIRIRDASEERPERLRREAAVKDDERGGLVGARVGPECARPGRARAHEVRAGGEPERHAVGAAKVGRRLRESEAHAEAGYGCRLEDVDKAAEGRVTLRHAARQPFEQVSRRKRHRGLNVSVYGRRPAWRPGRVGERRDARRYVGKVRLSTDSPVDDDSSCVEDVLPAQWPRRRRSGVERASVDWPADDKRVGASDAVAAELECSGESVRPLRGVVDEAVERSGAARK